MSNTRFWVAPAYNPPPDAQEEAVMRLVVKENFSRDMPESPASDLERAGAGLEEDQPKRRHPGREAATQGAC